MIRSKAISVIFLFLTIACTSFAQSGFYVPKQGSIFFLGDSATIFSNISNQGSFGIHKTAVVNFKGKHWDNDPASSITTLNNQPGGWVRFIADSFQQQLSGGYNAATKTGAAFYNLQVKNKWGIELLDGTTKVKNETSFGEGLIYLNDNIFVAGDNNPGKITGYDSSKYFVTGNAPGRGFLLRENISSIHQLVTFPVGTNATDYTPAAIRSHSVSGDDYYVNVIDSVRSSLFNGTAVINESVNKTWEIGKLKEPGTDDIEVILQHLNEDEGAVFAANKQNTFISYFNGVSWETNGVTSTSTSGYLTTGRPLISSTDNERLFSSLIKNASYFTKLTTTKEIPSKTVLRFNAYRSDASNVVVHWKTNPELNVHYFIVQRRLSNESSFTNVDTVASLAINGTSFNDLFYSINDPNGYTGISYYRLLLLPYNTEPPSYSNIVAVSGIRGYYNVTLWPNPNRGKFTISLNTSVSPKAIIMWNALGQKLFEESVNGRTIINIEKHGLAQGTYFVGIIGDDNNIIETKKVLILPE